MSDPGDALDEEGRAWWAAALALAAQGRPERPFAAALRHARAHAGGDPEGLALALRAALLAATPDRAAAAADLYRHGDAAERLGVLHALPGLLDRGLLAPDPARALVRDALRTNDSRLVAAGLLCAARLLDGPERVQAVLKAVFTGLGVAAVPGVEPAPDLAVALLGLVLERVVAGRTAGVTDPALWALVAPLRHDGAVPDLLQRLQALVTDPDGLRAAAARAALDALDGATP